MQHAQQLHLQLGRHLSDLVQEQTAAVGGAERAFLRLGGVAAAAEQLDFEGFFFQGAAIDDHEGRRAPRARLVDRARNEFLAGAALARDQHAGVGARDHVRQRQLFFQQRGARHDLGAPVLGVSRETGDAQRFFDVRQQFLLFHGLGQKRKRALLRGLHGIRDAAMRC